MKNKLKILAIGDVTSHGGIEHLKNNLWNFRKEKGIDFCVVNGENASLIFGISEEEAKTLLMSGADVITGGNHTMQNKSIYEFLDENENVLRPLNFGYSAYGGGSTISDAKGYRILTVNVMGNVHIEPTLDSPFPFIERALKENEGKYDFSILDIHAEATGEKLAIAHEFDGRINCIFGTHTHVPTADEQILPNGTGYITDVGMCGEQGGILGMDKDVIIKRIKTHLPEKYTPAHGAPLANAVIFTIDEKTKKTVKVERISF